MEKIDIINKALIKLGCETATAVTDDTKDMRLINQVYDGIKKEELQKHNWIFAKKRATIYCEAIKMSAENLAEAAASDDDITLTVADNVITVTAAEAGASGNDITLASTNKKITVSGATLTGGDVQSKASGKITFASNITAGDIITINSMEYVAGTDFEIGTSEDTNEFELPQDCLLLLEVCGYGPVATAPYQYGAYKPYDVAGRYIYADKEKITVEYTADIDTNKLDVNFVNVFACAIAAELCEAITQSDSKTKIMYEKYALAVRDAKRINAIQMPNASISAGILELSRL